MLRRCCCAIAVPIFPGDVPMIAVGFTFYAAWQFFWLYREPERPAGQDGME